MKKIIYETCFLTEHCGLSSLYVIKNSENEIHVTEKNGTKINNEEFKKMMSSSNIKEFEKKFKMEKITSDNVIYAGHGRII